MSKPAYFDCNCFIGRVAYPMLLDNFDVAGLRREMKTAGIEEALVYHSVGRAANPPLGNRLLMEAIGDIPELSPVWVVLPHHTGEIPPPKELLGEMEKQGVRAVRMFPTKDFHSFSLAEWCSGPLLAALAEARVPLILDIEIVPWESVQSILEAHPGLPVIAANVGYRHNRFSYPLLEQHETLYIETSRYFGAGNFEDVVNRFGPERMLFGTNMPLYTGTAAVTMLTYAEISREAKEAIAGKTLKRLLKEALS